MSLCWNIFSKVPWSCWYCECYLNYSFKFLRTTQLRNTVFWFSVIFIWKFLIWGAEKKDAEQQQHLSSHTIAAVFHFTGWSQTRASSTVSPDMHRVNLDYLWHFRKGLFKKKKTTSEISLVLIIMWKKLSNTTAYMMSVSVVLLRVSQIAELRLNISCMHWFCTPVYTCMVKF